MRRTPLAVFAVACLALAVVFLSGCGDKPKRQLSVYNWTEYMPEDVITDFEKETGIDVVLSTFESNEAMYAKVKLQGGEGYDIVVPSTYYVGRMAAEGMLAELDHSKLPNMSNLEPDIMDKPYDPGNKYSIPYMWGATGILYDSRKVDKAPDSWAALWDPALKGKVLLQDDLREVFGIALLQLGYGLNDTDPEHIKQAFEMLRGLMPSVRVFNSDNPKMPFLNEEVAIGMIWNGEAWQAMQENDALKWVWPSEGGIFWMDNLVVLKGAKHYDEALEFINYLLRPEVGARICQEYGYGTPNKGSLAMLPEDVRNNPVIYPPAEIMRKSEFQTSVGESILEYEKYWEQLKAGM